MFPGKSVGPGFLPNSYPSKVTRYSIQVRITHTLSQENNNPTQSSKCVLKALFSIL